MQDKQVIIITLNYNQNDYTLKCIDSILKSNYNNYMILLIDNGSVHDNYKELESKLPNDNHIILHRIEQNRGYVGGINYGLENGAKLNPDYFLIMNNDTILDKNAITELVSTCVEYNDKAIVTGKVYHYDEPNKLQDVGYTFKSKKRLQFNRVGLNEIDKGQYDKVLERDMLDDVFWLFSIKLYKKIDGYSPYFWFNAEQADFALRAKEAGYKLIYTPKAKLWHKGSVSIGGRYMNPKLAYWHIQSTLIMRYLHLSKFNFVVYFLIIMNSIIRTSLKSLFFRLKGDKSLMLYSSAKRKGLYYFLHWLIKRNENVGYVPF